MRTVFSPQPQGWPREDRRRVWLAATVLAVVSALPLRGLHAQDGTVAAEFGHGDDENRVAARGNAADDGVPVVDDVRVSSFQAITPGDTTLAELRKSMGPPLDEQVQGDRATVVYKVGPFPRIEFVVSGDVVNSIIIHLASPAAPDQVAEELGLRGFAPVPVEVEGDLLGQVFPERGVVFSFSPDTDDRRVSQLVLEPISAESFLMRAKSHAYRYQRALADLDYATKLEPDNAEVRWFRARVLAASQQHRAALEEANAAIRWGGSDPRFRLTRSELLFELDDYEQALSDAEDVLNRENVPQVAKARAQCLLGDLLAGGPSRDYGNAIKHHLAAIDSASKVANSADTAARLKAKRVMIDAHLAIANDITRGNWSKKAQAVPKWLRNADEFVKGAIRDDGADESLKLLMLRKALSSYAGMQGAVDPSDLLSKTLAKGQQLLGRAEDPLRKAELRWQLVGALFDAVRIEQIRGEVDSVLEHGQQSVKLLDEMAPHLPDTPRARYLIGRLHFYVGSTLAMHKNDHEEAVRWYENALPYLSREIPYSDTADRGVHGQRFVSMGVSYWQTDDREKAVRLTRQGLEMMKQATGEGTLDEQELAVAYSNLATMYKTLGRAKEADVMAARAAELEGPAGDDTQRR